jgi:RNA polymerase sigma factor (sigma-70 family)
MPDPPTDADLVVAAQAGDARGLAVLLERYRAGMHAVALGVLGHGPDAEDALQDGVMVALRRLDELRNPAAAGPWLRAIVRNVCRMRLRAARPGLLAPLPPTLRSGELSPEEVLDRQALRDWVWHALGELTEPLRVAAMRRYFSGVSSYDQIAALCGVPVGTVRSRLNQARRKLADALLATADLAHDGAAALAASRRREFADLLAAAGPASANLQHQLWAFIGRAEVQLRTGRAAEAAELLEAALALLARNPDRAEELRARGLLAVAHMRRGERESAVRASEQTLLSIGRLSAPTAHYLLEGYAAPAEIYLGLWETEGRRWLHQSRRAVGALRQFAGVFPIGEPRAPLWRGLEHWLSGRPGQVSAAWRRSLAAAERLGMAYEQARAHHELGRHLPPGEPARPEHIERAAALFKRVGRPPTRTRRARRCEWSCCSGHVADGLPEPVSAARQPCSAPSGPAREGRTCRGASDCQRLVGRHLGRPRGG